MTTPVPPLIYPDASFQTIRTNSGLQANGKITNVSEPTENTDAATKEYVDTNTQPITTLTNLTLTDTDADTLLSNGQINAASTENVDIFGFSDSGSIITSGGVKVEKDLFINGNLIIPQLASRQGKNTLSEGTAVIHNDTLTNFSCIYLTIQSPVNPGFLYISNITPGVSFTVTSSSVTDESIFSWVIFENTYICFHSSTRVFLKNRNGVTSRKYDVTSVRVDNLKYQDEVLVMDPVTNTMMYSKIIAFTGYFPDRLGHCVNIYTENKDEPLILSNIHLVYCSEIPDMNTFKFIKANDIKIGNYLLNSNNQFEKVSHVVNTQNTGWISPLTETGTIIVNDIVASCHTTDHEFAVWFYKPLKMFYKLFPNNVDSLPKGDHFYSITIRRGLIGRIIEKLAYLFWS